MIPIRDLRAGVATQFSRFIYSARRSVERQKAMYEPMFTHFVNSMQRVAEAHRMMWADSAAVVQNFPRVPRQRGQIFYAQFLETSLKAFLYQTRFSTFTGMLYHTGWQIIDLPDPGVACYLVPGINLKLMVTEVEENISLELVIPQSLLADEGRHIQILEFASDNSDESIWIENLQAYCCYIMQHIASRWYEYRASDIEIVPVSNPFDKPAPLVLPRPTLPGKNRSRWAHIANDRHRRIAELWDDGRSAYEIARMLGIANYKSVYNIAADLRKTISGACPSRKKR